MSDSSKDQPPPGSFVAQSSRVEQLPDETVAILSRMDFAVLRDGEVNEMKGFRDLCLGIFCSGLIGLIGLLATTNWAASMQAKSIKPYIWTALMIAIVLASGVLASICHHQAFRRKGRSAYVALMDRLTKHFPER